MQDASDLRLLRHWRAGDVHCGVALVRRHAGSLRRFFSRRVDAVDVDDLVQRTLAGCVESKDRFRGDAEFRAFLFAIARRQLGKHLRDSTRRRTCEFWTYDDVEPTHSPCNQLADQQERSLLVAALRRIPIEDRKLLELYYWEEMSGPDIATLLGISAGATRVRLCRARRVLAEILRGLFTPMRQMGA